MTNNKQQTPLEWFVERIQSDKIFNFENVLNQAKEMERQQKRKDFTDGYMHGSEPLNHDVIDKWYNKTYGGDNVKENN